MAHKTILSLPRDRGTLWIQLPRRASLQMTPSGLGSTYREVMRDG